MLQPNPAPERPMVLQPIDNRLWRVLDDPGAAGNRSPLLGFIEKSDGLYCAIRGDCPFERSYWPSLEAALEDFGRKADLEFSPIASSSPAE